MTLVNIDLRNAAREYGPDDKVTFSAPHYREGTGGFTVSTAPESVPLIKGIGKVELEPGPIVVSVKTAGWADSRPRQVVVPEKGPITLTALLQDDFDWTPVVLSEMGELVGQVKTGVARIEGIAKDFGSLEAVSVEVEAAKQAAVNSRESASESGTSAESAALSAESAAKSAGEVKVTAQEVMANAELVKGAADSAAWEGDKLTVLGATSPSLTGPVGPPGVVVSDTKPLNGEVWIRPDGEPTPAPGGTGGIVVVETAEEAQDLPVGTLYVVTGPLVAAAKVTGSAAGEVNGEAFTVTIPGATAGDMVVVGVNTKAVSGMTLKAPAGFSAPVEAYWVGTQTSWVFIGSYAPGMVFTASAPAEVAWSAVAASGVTGHAVGKVKDRGTAPAETTTVTALPVEAGAGDIVLGFAFERTSAVETAEQVTVNAGWEKLAFSTQGQNVQTVLVARGAAGATMTATYPNSQATNGVGVQVVLRA